MKKIRQKDKVIVIAGKDKGSVGTVMRVKGDKVLVQGINFMKKHVKPNPNVEEPGGIKELEAPLHVSNVAILNPTTEKADKVGFRVEKQDDGSLKKHRYFKSNNEIIDIV